MPRKFQSFTVDIDVSIPQGDGSTDGDSGVHDSFDACVDVGLPEHLGVTNDNLKNLTKRIAVLVGDFLRDTYTDAEIDICT